MSSFKASNKQAIDMQKTILDFAREQVAEFLSRPVRPTFFKGASAPDLTTFDYTSFSPDLIFHEESDRVAVTSSTVNAGGLSDWLSRVNANARDAATKAKIERNLQEAFEIIKKPVNSQGGQASGTAESHSSINSTDLPRAPSMKSRPRIGIPL
ncbi:hypothetical protein E4U30_004271 [Claviceps sp. LM220 group G6]|nr:hypothetical protein E4U30_004271 [Claviceps sp. LM220 group G6]